MQFAKRYLLTHYRRSEDICKKSRRKETAVVCKILLCRCSNECFINYYKWIQLRRHTNHYLPSSLRCLKRIVRMVAYWAIILAFQQVHHRFLVQQVLKNKIERSNIVVLCAAISIHLVQVAMLHEAAGLCKPDS